MSMRLKSVSQALYCENQPQKVAGEKITAYDNVESADRNP